MRRILTYLFPALLIVIPLNSACASIPAFFQQLFLEVEKEYGAHLGSKFNLFCASHGLDSLSSGNLRTFLQINFFHDLFTCTSASNCSRGGILEIPYFWHWVDPNPRHSILSLPDSTLLSDMRPPSPYTLYKSYADIDRVPAMYLGDLVSETAGYSHHVCGTFFTFGWCSEREMSFLSLMISFGYSGKIRQSGIHTYSVLWCEFDGIDGGITVLSAYVDNTFASIHWRPVPVGAAVDHWLSDIGTGTQISWYNRTARSHKQLEKLRNTPVSNAARERILAQVLGALRGRE